MSGAKNLRTPVGLARGLGSAKEGVGHWWAMRITSVALIPLGLWLMWSLLTLVGADPLQMQQWLGKPLHAATLILFLLFGLHHSAQGVQVVIEDYLQAPWKKNSALVLNALLHLGAAGLGVFAVLHAALRVA